MKLLQVIESAIAEGMETFTIAHHEMGRYHPKYEQTADAILEYIKGYEDCDVITAWFGTFWHATGEFTGKHPTYNRPKHCHLVYKLPNEELLRH